MILGSRPAACDLGSRYVGLASAAEGLIDIRAHQIVVDDEEAAAADILAWLIDDGATSLIFEWSGFHKGKTDFATVAMQKHRETMLRIMWPLVSHCRAAGIAVADRDTLKACKGPGLISVQSWRSRCGAVVTTRDAEGKPEGGWDRYVKHALTGILGADIVASTLDTVHKRDAAGTLIGYLRGAPPRAAQGRRRTKREYTAHRALLAGARRRRQVEREALARAKARGALPPDALRPCGCRRRYRHAAACEPGAASAVVEALADAGGQLTGPQLAAALGIAPTSLPHATATDLRRGAIARESGARVHGRIGRPPTIYKLTT